MTNEEKPPRQPLFWAAVVFSVGLWTGARAWRPPSWWVIALVAFVFAASCFFRNAAEWPRFSLWGAWFILGAFVIQIRGQEMNESRDAARILGLADGRSVILTAGVIRDGYAREAGPKSVTCGGEDLLHG